MSVVTVAFHHHEGLGDTIDKDDLDDDLTIHSVGTVTDPNAEPAPDFFQSTDEITVANNMLIKSGVHIRAQFAMRKLKHLCADDACEDRENNALHKDHCYSVVGYFAQNLHLPHFGAAQPGETYYYSPLSIFIFGLVDLSTKPPRSQQNLRHRFTKEARLRKEATIWRPWSRETFISED
jgi:hypothetical protein